MPITVVWNGYWMPQVPFRKKNLIPLCENKKQTKKQWPFFLYTEQFTHLCRIKIFFFFWNILKAIRSFAVTPVVCYSSLLMRSLEVLLCHGLKDPPWSSSSSSYLSYIQPKPAGQHWFPFWKKSISFQWAPMSLPHVIFSAMLVKKKSPNTSKNSRSLTPISRKWSLRRPSPSSPHLQACERGSEKSQHWNMPDLGESTRWQDERGTRGWKVVSAARLSGYMSSSESRP